VSEDKYQFQVGDIVKEKEFITIGYDDQMIGIVLAVESTYHMNERVVHDRLTIMWLDNGNQEEMPDVLVELVSSVVDIKKLD
jgi:hypothetical protein